MQHKRTLPFNVNDIVPDVMSSMQPTVSPTAHFLPLPMIPAP